MPRRLLLLAALLGLAACEDMTDLMGEPDGLAALVIPDAARAA